MSVLHAGVEILERGSSFRYFCVFRLFRVVRVWSLGLRAQGLFRTC